MLPPRRLTLIAAICLPVLAFLSLVAWSFASPIGSSPDDDFHLASIWCGLGERTGLCEDPGGDDGARLVPAAVDTATCYRFLPQDSGACTVTQRADLVEVPRANVEGLYPRVFYGVMSTLASPDVPASVAAMRIVNSAIAVGLLTAVFWALPRSMRPALLVSVLATAVPLGVFVLASVNPSSWALLSASALWICLYAALRTDGRRRIVLIGLSLLATVMGAGARADSAVYAAFAVVLVLVMSLSRRRAVAPALILGAVVVAIAIAFYASAVQGGSVVTGMRTGTPPLTAMQNIQNLLNVPALWTGAFGGWGLGWLDTPLPAVVAVLGTALFGGVLLVGLARIEPRRGVALLLSFLAMGVVPFVLLYQSRAVVGELVQPRYILPLMIITVGIAALRPDGGSAWRGTRLWVAGVALVTTFAISLHVDINRYVTGLDDLHLNLDKGIEWWWTGVPSPMTVWAIGTVSFAGIFVVLTILDRRGLLFEPAAANPENAVSTR